MKYSLKFKAPFGVKISQYIGGLVQFMFIENLRRKRLPSFISVISFCDKCQRLETCAWYNKMFLLSISG